MEQRLKDLHKLTRDKYPNMFISATVSMHNFKDDAVCFSTIIDGKYNTHDTLEDMEEFVRKF